MITGAILFRGFPDGMDPDCLNTILPGNDFDYVGGAAPRTRISSTILTANDAPSDACIPFHHELAHATSRPSHVLFHAVQPATGPGGQTVLTDSRALANHVRVRWSSVASDLDDGIVYRRTLPETTDVASPIGRSWREAFGVRTRVEAERKMAMNRMSWKWTEAGLWTQSSSLPAFRHHPVSGQSSFYNSLLAAYVGWNDTRNTGSSSVLFAKNEQPIPVEFVRDVQRVAWQGRFECEWETGDVLLVDNAITMHARNPFVGNRTVLVRMLTS